MNDMELLYEVAKLAEFDACDSIWWRRNSDRAEDATGLNVFAQCSDFFDWGSADMEQITPDNLPVLREAMADVREVSGSEFSNQDDAFLLFCSRVRKRRPQGAYYKYLTVHHADDAEAERRTVGLRALFDACGAERGIDVSNPKDQDGTYKYTPEAASEVGVHLLEGETP